MARYGKKASEKGEKAMRERKRGTLRSGRSGRRVKSRKQAIAIGLAQARRAGGKVPRKTSAVRRVRKAKRRVTLARARQGIRKGRRRATVRRAVRRRARRS
jgi:hypothetical protein